MTARRSVLLAVCGAAAAVLLAVVGCATAGFLLSGDDPTDPRTCQESVQVAEAKVRTGRWDPPTDLPDLGDYPEIHWQLRAPGNPCSRMPGPTDFAYQGVVRLRPGDAQALAKRYEFVPWASVKKDELPHGSSPADVWPALVPFLPSEPRWLHSRSYNETPPSPRWRVAFLDVEHQTLLFMLNDH
ncbi:hypothetical protein GCE86_10030 [Micromonospora terminaliae]|uniref:DUF3558 domain-containing protein n=1 Tax=Micromonospora terminaliae TaxID=1914461 RepID=A0AAJ3DIL0_9ACTN|nr:hypothetical protein [Micromonospora terminaliae]NES27887.1 hypothetical protein [Micromonospora terminaliae]QGL47340.1 hypothetical protein GCE86_10030 [Micromonospora terminaliae]